MKLFLEIIDIMALFAIFFMLTFVFHLTFGDWQWWVMAILIFITRQLRLFTAKK